MSAYNKRVIKQKTREIRTRKSAHSTSVMVEIGLIQAAVVSDVGNPF